MVILTFECDRHDIHSNRKNTEEERKHNFARLMLIYIYISQLVKELMLSQTSDENHTRC